MKIQSINKSHITIKQQNYRGKSMRTPLLIEQHFHGAYGVDFNKSNADEIAKLANKLKAIGIGGFFPTLVTDSIDNLKRQISEIKKAAKNCREILGIHLEGVFLNPEKKGIHNEEHFLELTPQNYQKLEDDFIKIVTLAPELDNGLIDYLKKSDIKVQAGHCIGWAKNSNQLDGVTHTFNAMSRISHKEEPSTALNALIDDNVYTEVIADGVHVSDKALKLLFKNKPEDKVILISDALPITYSDIKDYIFADSLIHYDGERATSATGTLAGSTKLLPEIVKIIGKKGMFNPKYIENTYKYHNIEPRGELEWDEEFNITKVTE